MKRLIILAIFGMPLWATHTCGVGVGGGKCYVAANGSDSNSGATTVLAWLHAPGMPAATGNAATQVPVPGDKYIFRGGDTWHTGNPTPSSGIATGGTWVWTWSGTFTTCLYEGTQTGCIYIGVDPTWFTGGSWTRPILTGDNPTSASPVASCAFQTGPITSSGSGSSATLIGNSNDMVKMSSVEAVQFDNFELTGLCGQTQPSNTGDQDTYVSFSGNGRPGMIYETNLYIHGWSETTNIVVTLNQFACVGLGGGNNGLQTITNVVIDGADSDKTVCVWGAYPSFYHFAYNVIRNTTDGLGQWCHDIHDNLFEYLYQINENNNGDHSNILECNQDAFGNASGQPQNTPNVFYNNVSRHNQSNVGWWHCPNTIPEYWFNNLIYDGTGQMWDVAGPALYPQCTHTGGVFKFNNTHVDGASGGWTDLCYGGGSDNTHGQYQTTYNEHLINTGWDNNTITPTCTGGWQDPSNPAQSDASANTQGYTTGSAGTWLANTCANESGGACQPTSSSAISVTTAGRNLSAYCSTLASFSATESAIGVDAANACQKDIASVSYDATAHAVIYPARIAVARPSSGAWNLGAYQFGSVSSSPLSLSFGNQAVNTTSSQLTATISNNSGSSMTSVSFSIIGTNLGDFSCSAGTLGSTLATGSTGTILCSFTPTATGSRSASIQLTYSGPTGSPFTVPLSGTGTSSAPITSYAPTSLSFPNTNLSVTSAAMNIVLTNTGSASLTSISLATTGNFAVSSTTPATNCGGTLAPAATCTISVTFTPASAGLLTGTLRVTSNAASSVDVLNLSGTGVDPTAINLVQVTNCGGQSFPGSCTIPGVTAGDLLAISIASAFGFSPTITSIAAAGGTCAEAGSARSVDTNTTSMSDIWYCTGVTAGTTSLTITPSSTGSMAAVIYEWGNVNTLDQTAILSNQPSTASPISGPAVTIATAKEALVSIANVQTSVTGIGGGSTWTNSTTLFSDGWAYKITGSTGTYTPTWTTSSSGTYNASTASFKLVNGGTPIVSLSVSSLTFGGLQTLQTSSPSLTVTLTNNGTASLTITSIVLGGTNPGDFSQSTTCGGSLAVNVSCTVTETFKPTAAGVRTASVAFTTNAATSPDTVTLTGTAIVQPTSFGGAALRGIH